VKVRNLRGIVHLSTTEVPMTVYRDTEQFQVPEGLHLYVVGCDASDIDDHGHTHFELLVTGTDEADVRAQVKDWIDDSGTVIGDVDAVE
jgi:hypothetical protein